MPQQYPSFNVESPNIDVNLFARSDAAGIAAGNAQKTKTQSIIEGVQEGIKFAADLNQQLAQTEAIKIQNEFRSDPEVRAAFEEQEIQQAALMKQKAELGLLENTEKLKTEALEIEARGIAAKDKIADADALKRIGETLRNPSPETGVALLEDRNVLNYTLKNPEVAQQIYAGLSPVVGKDRLDPFLQTANAKEIADQEMRLEQADRVASQKQAEKNQDRFDAAAVALKNDNTLKAMMEKGVDGQKFRPERMHIVNAGQVARDPKTQQPLFNADGSPQIASEALPEDKRYWAIYDGKVRATFDQDRGKKYSDALTDYQSGAQNILTTSKGPPTTQESIGDDFGLASGRTQDNIIESNMSPSTEPRTTPKVPPAVLEGKTLEQQQAITTKFNNRIQRLQNLPKEVREVVDRVNSNPILKNSTPMFKAVASAESRGDHSAKSHTGVKGLMQVTGATFDDIVNQHPEITGLKELKGTEAGSYIAGKVYLIDLFETFKDTQLTLAAYNAGPGVLAQAVQKTAGQKTWENVRENLRGLVSEEKFKEVYEYPERVLRYYTIYNG